MRPRPPPSPSPSSPSVVAAAAALEELARDFLERQEAVAFGAVVDEARFEAGLDAGDDGLVDVALALFLACGLDVEVDQLLAVDDRHPEFLRLGGVEQHAFHSIFPARIRPGMGGAKRRPRSSRGVTLSSGGRVQRPTTPAAVAARRRERGGRLAVQAGASASTVSRRCSLVDAEGFMVAFKRSSCRLSAPLRKIANRGNETAWSRNRRQVRRAMRRFEPATSRVRRLRSSFTIPTSPGRNARTVSGFNRRPIYATCHGRLCPTLRGLRLAGGALAILGCPRSPPYGSNR